MLDRDGRRDLSTHELALKVKRNMFTETLNKVPELLKLIQFRSHVTNNTCLLRDVEAFYHRQISTESEKKVIASNVCWRETDRTEISVA